MQVQDKWGPDNNRSATMKWQRWLSLALIVALLATLATTVASRPAQVSVQPQLARMAVEQPDETVRVIVLKRDQSVGIEELVAGSGGRVVRDLHIINALAVEMPARAALTLADERGVRGLTLDAPVQSSGNAAKPGGPGGPGGQAPANYFLDTLNVRPVWDMGLRGNGVTIAVIDSGISSSADFCCVVEREAFNKDLQPMDNNGHGSHVAGIAAGNGSQSNGLYTGIAPNANLISLNVSNSEGMAYESDTVAAMQWALDNKDAYNIRIVNLSINAAHEVSYHASAMDAAAEMLWFNGVVVVTAAGNMDASTGYDPVITAPANDPFVITVGSSDEKGTSKTKDDVIAMFSSYDETIDLVLKPDIIAPGKDIISVLASNSDWSKDHADRVVDGKYFRASGTSMAAPMVAGAVALLLQDEPNLTPDQVKYRLLATAGRVGKAPYLDVYAAVTGTTTESANTGLQASQLLWSGSGPLNWDSVNWDSVNWDSVNWDSVNWDSVNWDSVNWDSVFWGE